ncbi:lactoylglutathione lyase-like protein, partial [Trifolium pratense]
CTVAIMGYGPEEKSTVLELTSDYGVTTYDKGDAYAQITIGTDDVYKTAEAIKLAGGKITHAGPVPGLASVQGCIMLRILPSTDLTRSKPGALGHPFYF